MCGQERWFRHVCSGLFGTMDGDGLSSKCHMNNTCPFGRINGPKKITTPCSHQARVSHYNSNIGSKFVISPLNRPYLFGSCPPTSGSLNHVSRLLSGYHVLVAAAFHLQLAQTSLIVVVAGKASSAARRGVRNFDHMLARKAVGTLVPALMDNKPKRKSSECRYTGSSADSDTSLGSG